MGPKQATSPQQHWAIMSLALPSVAAFAMRTLHAHSRTWSPASSVVEHCVVHVHHVLLIDAKCRRRVRQGSQPVSSLSLAYASLLNRLNFTQRLATKIDASKSFRRRCYRFYWCQWFRRCPSFTSRAGRNTYSRLRAAFSFRPAFSKSKARAQGHRHVGSPTPRLPHQPISRQPLIRDALIYFDILNDDDSRSLRYLTSAAFATRHCLQHYSYYTSIDTSRR